MDSCLPVIAVTCFGDKRTRQEAARRGATDFFHKPFSYGRLYRRMVELVALAPRRLATEEERNLLILSHRRLQKLKEQQARLGSNAPPELLIEIEDLENELTGGYNIHNFKV